MANSEVDLEDVITSSIEDSITPEDPDEETSSAEAAVDTANEAIAESNEAPPADTTAQVAEPVEVQSPAAVASTPTQLQPKPDDFEKKFGIPAQSSSGRENRIPYSRVKKIVEKQSKELEAQYKPKLDEYTAKVTDYEGRLQKVAQFEQVLANEPQKFLQMLSTLPAYKQIFDGLVQHAYEQAMQQQQTAQPTTSTQPPQIVADDMPQPDQKLSDGSLVYSMDGLKALNTWNRAQARKEVMTEVEKRYAPMEQEWQANQQIQALIPQVQAQIDSARKWPNFNENEAEIVKALQSDQSISLERAYQMVVLPKLQQAADTSKVDQEKLRNDMRKQILAEMKQRPMATSAPTGAVKPGAQASGPRSLEDIITESIQGLK